MRFSVGDVVLISLRDCEVPKADLEKGVRGNRGDILDRFHPKQYAELKESGVNHSIFAQMESITAIASKLESGDIAGAQAIADTAEEDIFDRGDADEEEEEVDLDAPQETVLGAGIKVEKKDKVSKRPKVISDEVNLDDL